MRKAPTQVMSEEASSFHTTLCDETPIEGEDVEDAPHELEKGVQAAIDELKKVDLGTLENSQPIFITTLLFNEDEEIYVTLLNEYIDVFAWTYKEMPGLDPKVAVHRLAVKRACLMSYESFNTIDEPSSPSVGSSTIPIEMEEENPTPNGEIIGLEGMEGDVAREVEEVEGDCEPYKKKQRKKSSVPNKKLISDCCTRWNATFAMLSCALDFKLVFPRYQLRDPNYKCLPSDNDWQKVEEICSLLVHFNEVTKIISGSEYPTANLFLPELYNIKEIPCLKSESLEPWMENMDRRMQQKFDKYWGC
nr:zinc finger BED domain-containing protein RICESLEEPER 2-like [Ipomoea batatas]